MPHARAWLVLGPAVLAGVLAGHGLAYRMTGTPQGPEHDYLAHGGQVILILLVFGVVLAGAGRRVRLPSRSIVPLAAVGTFVVQEHIERLVHTGTLPWLLTTPAFLVGLALQIPIAALAWMLARGVLEVLVDPRAARGVRRPWTPVVLVPLRAVDLPAAVGAPLPGRGPPRASPS